jgi:hypothetical protein
MLITLILFWVTFRIKPRKIKCKNFTQRLISYAKPFQYWTKNGNILFIWYLE